MKLKKRALFIIILVIIAAGGIYFSYSSSKAPKKVTVTTPKYQNIETTISSGGKIQAVNQRSLSFNSSGKLLYMPYEEGDEVKKGQVLGYLDQSEAKEQTNSERSGVEIKQGKSRKHKTDNQVGTVGETDIVIFER